MQSSISTQSTDSQTAGYICNQSGREFLQNPHKSITLLGMSGVGKTTLANVLPSSSWFKFSGDYRLGTRYLDEAILDNIKRQAMQVPFLKELLRTDSLYICHNITINNLYPISSFLGKVGRADKGGIEIQEFLRRQQLHHDAEVAAMYDVLDFIEKGQAIYGYPHFINDASGSLSELEDPNIHDFLARHTLILYLEATDEMLEKLLERGKKQPKPLYYKQDFFLREISDFCKLEQSTPEQIDPDKFIQWVLPKLISERLPRYQKIAQKYGVTIDASIIEDIKDAQGFMEVIAEALDKRNHSE